MESGGQLLGFPVSYALEEETEQRYVDSARTGGNLLGNKTLGKKVGSSIVSTSCGLGLLLAIICIVFFYCACPIWYTVAMLGKLFSLFLSRRFSYANFAPALCSTHLLVTAQLELDFIRALKVSRSCDPLKVQQDRRLRSYYSS